MPHQCTVIKIISNKTIIYFYEHVIDENIEQQRA